MFSVGITAFGGWLEAKVAEVAEQLGSVIRILAITFFLRTIRMAHRTRRWELLTRLVLGSLCAG